VLPYFDLKVKINDIAMRVIASNVFGGGRVIAYLFPNGQIILGVAATVAIFPARVSLSAWPS
jgi:hypothetical protein